MKNLCEKIVKKLKEKNKTIAFMESCTGGYLANLITNIPGASDVLKVSLVTYSNEYKIKFGVDKETIEKYTVYSIETAKSMAKNVAEFANSNIGVGITGELGNNNKKENKVYFCIYNKDSNAYIYNELNIKISERENMKIEVAKNILEKIDGGLQ